MSHKEVQAKWRAAHREQERARKAKYRIEHSEQIHAYSAKYRADHREQTSAHNAKYYAEHHEQRQAYDAKYRAEHQEQIRVRSIKFYTEHPEQKCARVANYQHRKRANGGSFSYAAWEHLKTIFGHCCAYCKRRMQRLTQDHVVPISKGGWHFSGNIVPACQSCNSRKGAK